MQRANGGKVITLFSTKDFFASEMALRLLDLSLYSALNIPPFLVQICFPGMTLSTLNHSGEMLSLFKSDYDLRKMQTKAERAIQREKSPK